MSGGPIGSPGVFVDGFRRLLAGATTPPRMAITTAED
jgi:hypothetical protein